MSLQQLQQEIQRMSDTPQEYENMIAAMQKMNEFAKQTNVKEMQEGGRHILRPGPAGHGGQ